MHKILAWLFLLCLLLVSTFQHSFAQEQLPFQSFVLTPCSLPVPYTGAVPTNCFAWYYTPRQGQPVDYELTQPVWTLAEIFTPDYSGLVTGVNIFGQCGGQILSGDCDSEDMLTIYFYTLNPSGMPDRLLTSQMVPVSQWPAVGSGGEHGNCGNFESCGATRFVAFYDQPVLEAGHKYAFMLSSAFEGGFTLGDQVGVVLGQPDIGSVPIFGGVAFDQSATPDISATPELDSLVLFGSGILGGAVYILKRYRIRS